MGSISVSRHTVFQFALPILFACAIAGSWSSSPSSIKNAENQDPKHASADSLEIRAYTLQWKIALGGLEYLEQKRKELGHDRMAQAFRSQAVFSLERGMILAAKDHPLDPAIIRRLLALSSYLELAELQRQQHNRLSSIHDSSEEPDPADALLLKLLHPKNPQGSVSDEEFASLQQQMPWYAAIAAYTAEKTTDAGKRYRRLFTSAAVDIFQKFVVAVVLGGIAALCSLFSLLYFVIRWFRRGFTRRFHFGGMESFYCREIFCLYLGAMLIIPYILGELFESLQPVTLLRFNALAFFLLAFLILWPTAFGVRREALSPALGFDFPAESGIVREIVVGIVTYLASLIPFFILLVLYQLVLQALGVEASKGAHPVVPMLTSSSDNSTAFWIFVLAVIVAPFVEEIMFRGALYRWLRSRLSAAPAILLSGMLFASVHPQGLIGMVPLTVIGCLTAALREWRQSLIAPMAAHACFNSATLIFVLTFLR